MHVSEYVCNFVIKNKPFSSKNAGKPLIILTACNFNKILLFPKVFSRAPSNGSFWKCNKYAVSLQYEQYDGILVYNGIFQQNFLSVLAQKFTNISAESIAGKNKIY